LSELQAGSRVRLDKWLWAARFFKTRSLAAQAVDGGRIRLNGSRTKPAKDVHAGDELVVHIGELEWIVRVRGLSGQRRSAAEAQQLYEETEESRQRRLDRLAVRKAQAGQERLEGGRPTKRNRRMIRRFTEGSGGTEG
jgi:ribosome-associated heat shock protein Hsp15